MSSGHRTRQSQVLVLSSKYVLSSSSPVQAPALCNLQGCFSILIGLLGLRQTSIDAGMPISGTRSACSTAATWSMHTITCTPKAVPERKRIVFQVMNEKKIERQMNEIQKKKKKIFFQRQKVKDKKRLSKQPALMTFMPCVSLTLLFELILGRYVAT